jgi:hypothetical protein
MADFDFGFEELIQEEEFPIEENEDEENYFQLESLVELQIENDDDEEGDEDEEIVEKNKKPTVDKKKFYVDPKEFDTEIMNYYDSGIISNNLAEMINRISHKLSYASNFINYSYREEMVGDGVVRMMKALIAKKYDRDKGTNPFSYFTRIAFNAFRNRIKKEKHIHETHEKYQEELTLLSLNYNNIVKNKNASYNKKYN